MDIKTIAEALKALGDETRLKMIAMLTWTDELCVCDFERFLGISQPNASRHLKQLKTSGWISDRRDGVWIRYKISDSLSKEQQLIIASLKDIFAHRKYAALRKSLRLYLKQKANSANACPAITTELAW